MQLGFVSAILPEYSLDELLRFAKAEGFACVEAMCWPVGKAERKYAGVTHALPFDTQQVVGTGFEHPRIDAVVSFDVFGGEYRCTGGDTADERNATCLHDADAA